MEGGGRQRRVVGAFIAVWLALQIGLPLVRKFELPSLRYRHRTYGWSMFSRPERRLTVDLHRRDVTGRREPIPGLERFVRGMPVPGEPWHLPYRSEPEVEAWLARLVEHVAQRSTAGWEYVATVRWLRTLEPGWQVERELSAPGARP